MSSLGVKNLVKRYGDKTVLDGFSCSFAENKVTCLMGPSGCGKTTLLRLIMGLEKPDGGSILFPEKTRFACVFQENRLFRAMSAVKNLKLATRASEAEILELLSLMGLEGSRHKPVRQLSGGMMRRVAIARALLAPSDVIVMDEALKGLDEKTRERILETIQERSRGKTLIFVTHDPRDVSALDAALIDMGSN